MAGDYKNKWYVSQTLLGCEPGHDTNRRFIYRGEDKIYTFNDAMAVWEVWKDEALHRVCRELNSIEESK